MGKWKHRLACAECGDSWSCFEECHAEELAAFRRQLDSMCHNHGGAVEPGQGSVLFGVPSPDNPKV